MRTVEAGRLRLVEGSFVQGLADPQGLVLATTNGTLRKDGSLVMGAGSARVLSERFPTLPLLLGKEVAALPKPYGLAVVSVQGKLLGGFQTKEDWREPAKLSLVAYSAALLEGYLTDNPKVRAHLPLPGVGLGGLPEGEVLAVLERVLWRVADRVIVYRWSG